MEIGPISALRLVTMIKRPLEDPDLSRVVEVEQRGRSGDDEYTAGNQKASRGLEDEEEEGPALTDFEGPKDTDAPATIVSFIA